MTSSICKKITCPVILGLCIATLSQNAQSHMLDGFEITGALGNSWYHADNSTIQITFDERDANQVASSSSNLLYSAGIGRHLWTDTLNKNKMMTGLLVEANYYYGDTTVKGNVWGYESPNVNNYTFRAPMSSSRLMLDIKPELFVYKGFTPYGIIGAGASWNKMSYAESLISADAAASSVVGLQEHASVTVAYDLGCGISTSLTKRIQVALEYVYSSLGRISPSTNYTTEQFIVNAPDFAIASQSVLMRVSWKLDGVNDAPVARPYAKHSSTTAIHANNARNAGPVTAARPVTAVNNPSKVSRANPVARAKNVRDAEHIAVAAPSYPETHSTWS